ncbi:MAG: GNAT family N-acetyltransferase, partial [Verrucomicrobiota bacterium]
MNLAVVDALTEEQTAQLCALYQHEWWTAGRELNDVRIMLRHTPIVIGLVSPDEEELLAFARVLTDYTFKALVLDVIVKSGYTGNGWGRVVMDRIMGHPDLQSVRHFELYCKPEMVPFYEKWGFTSDLGDLALMRHQRKGDPS